MAAVGGVDGGEHGSRLSPDAVLAAVDRLLVDEAPEGLAATVWLVGGAVRDASLGLPVRDVDLVVRGPVERLASRLADELGGAVYAVSERFATYRVIVPGGHIDLAPLRGATLEEDLRARDFTVNAVARSAVDNDVGAPAGDEARDVEPAATVAGRLVDPLEGVRDIEEGRLVPCSPDALADDPVRVIRMARLQCGLGLQPAEGVEELARAAASSLAQVSGERLEKELTALLGLPGPAAADGLRELDRLGALAVVLPEVAGTCGVTQNPYHHLDVFEHTLEALGYVGGVVAQLGGPAPLASPSELGLGDAGPLVPLRWALLLHDIGKPAARAVDSRTGRVLFWYHDEIGSRMVSDVARRLRFSRRFEQYLATLVRHHLHLGFLAREQPLSLRALARFRRTVKPYVFEALVLSLSDRMATRGEGSSPKSIARHFRLAREVWEGLPAPAPRLLSGNDVMSLLDLPPGPLVGAALDAVDEEAEAGEVTTREEAKRWLASWWKRRGRELDKHA